MCDVFKMAAKHFGWTTPSPMQWVDDIGRIIALESMAPAMLKWHLRQSLYRKLCNGAVDRYEDPGSNRTVMVPKASFFEQASDSPSKAIVAVAGQEPPRWRARWRANA